MSSAVNPSPKVEPNTIAIPRAFVFREDCTPIRLAVLVGLIHLADREKHQWRFSDGHFTTATREQIAVASRCGIQSVTQCLKWWESIGAIEVQPEPQAISQRRILFQWRKGV